VCGVVCIVTDAKPRNVGLVWKSAGRQGPKVSCYPRMAIMGIKRHGSCPARAVQVHKRRQAEPPRPFSSQGLDLSDNGFTRIPPLDALRNLRSLGFAWNTAKVLRNIERLPQLTVGGRGTSCGAVPTAV